MWWSRRCGRFDPFELPTWISINTYGQIVVNVWLLQRDFVPAVPWLQNNYRSMTTLAVVLFGVGLTFMWLGYAFVYRRLQHKPILPRPVTESLRLRPVIVIWFVTWLISTFAVVAGVQGYLTTKSNWQWQNYLSFIQLVGNAAWSALLLYHFRHPTPIGRVWMVFTFGWSIVLALVIGTKGASLLFIWLLMHIYYATGRLRGRWLMAGVVVAVLLIPSVNLIRSYLHAADTGGGVSFSQRLQIAGSAAQEAVSRPVSELYNETRDTFEARQSGLFPITASALYLHPNVSPFVAMDTVLYFLQQSIPRILWPSKPIERSPLYMITTDYLGATVEYSFSDIGQFADSYRIGGWPFVVVWFLAMGALSAWLYRRGPAVGNAAGIVFYIVMLNDVLRYSEPVAIIMLRLLQMGILLWLILRFVFFKTNQQLVESSTSPLLQPGDRL